MLEYNVEYQETIKKTNEKTKQNTCSSIVIFLKKLFDISVILNLSTFDRYEYFISVWHNFQKSAHDRLKSVEYLL